MGGNVKLISSRSSSSQTYLLLTNVFPRTLTVAFIVSSPVGVARYILVAGAANNVEIMLHFTPPGCLATTLTLVGIVYAPHKGAHGGHPKDDPQKRDCNNEGVKMCVDGGGGGGEREWCEVFVEGKRDGTAVGKELCVTRECEALTHKKPAKYERRSGPQNRLYPTGEFEGEMCEEQEN